MLHRSRRTGGFDGSLDAGAIPRVSAAIADPTKTMPKIVDDGVPSQVLDHEYLLSHDCPSAVAGSNDSS